MVSACSFFHNFVIIITTEVDDLTSDAAYVNVAMENGKQRACVEIHRAPQEEKKPNLNITPDREKKSITVSFKRHREEEDRY